MNIQPVNLTEKFALFNDYWSPKIAGDLNNHQVKLAKLKGEFEWHHHDNEDELFLVVKGTLLMHLEDKTLTVKEGEFVIIPKGIEHKPEAKEEVHVVLVEPNTTLNTGNIESDFTVKNLQNV